MIFNEVYGIYYNVVGKILKEAVKGEISLDKIKEITGKEAFGESITVIPDKLLKKQWPLMDANFETPLKNNPDMPLTTIEKMWLKAILSDKRISLFEPSFDGLEDVEPLYDKDTFVYFDRYSDGDPYDDIEYREHFRLILVAIKERRIVRIVYKGRKGKRIHTLIPKGLEYSSKDDKFRLVAESLKGTQYIINMQKITKCQVMEGFEKDSVRKRKLAFGEVILQLKDYRKALERAMLSFSDLEKETIKLDNDTYQIKLKYCVDDETEILIRILAFGPLIEVMGPDDFRDKIKERLLRQRKL